jgi:hypothetical protein
MSLVSKLLVGAGVAALAAGCGGSDSNDGGGAGTSSANVSSYCSTVCNRLNECDSTEDAQTCTRSCENSLAAVGPKLRGEYLNRIQQCFTQKDCANILSGDAHDDCEDEAVAALAPTSTGTAFCDGYSNVATRCGSSLDKADCLDDTKLFNDSALNTAMSCFDRACSAIDDCVEAALGD